MTLSNIKKIYLVNGNDGRLKEWIADIGEVSADIHVMIFYTGAAASHNKLLIKEISADNERIENRLVDKPKKRAIQKAVISYINIIRSTRPDIQIAILGPHYSSPVMLDYEMRGIITYVNAIDHDLQTITSDGININDDEIQAGGRMHILIDYENVNEAGLVGSDLLGKLDSVTLFYSDAALSVKRLYFDDIRCKAGNFEAVKLRNTGKICFIASEVWQR